MSNSDEGREKIETPPTQLLFHVSKSTTTLVLQDDNVTGSSSGTTAEREEEDRHLQITKAVASLGGLGAGHEEEDESGFKTPTSPDHRLPGVTLCPGAPRKPNIRFTSRKRKASGSSASSSSLSPSSSSTPPPSSGVRRSLLLDLSQELESLFPGPILADTHREMKRARSGGNGGVSQ